MGARADVQRRSKFEEFTSGEQEARVLLFQTLRDQLPSSSAIKRDAMPSIDGSDTVLIL